MSRRSTRAIVAVPVPSEPTENAGAPKRAHVPLVDRDEVVNSLGRITAPTLVLHGSVDPCYAPSHGEEIANGVADCRGFVLVEGGAHFLSLTDPEPVNTALQELFEALA
jgi:pimeloyl-ACP methyl ester carboxylesterase